MLISPCRMLFFLVALIYFMVDPLVSIGRSFPNFDDGGDWQYGDVRWVGVDNSYFPECKDVMKINGNTNGNWPLEENPATLPASKGNPAGAYHNVPRYYLRCRRASDNRRVQFIASRAPIARGLDDIAVRDEPVPIDRDQDPDTFNDIRGKKQFADIFCRDSRITSVRDGGRTRPRIAKIIKNCGIIELLVLNCMKDHRVITEESKDQLIRETFDVAWPYPTENANFKLMVQNRCESFFRLENISRHGRNLNSWVELFNRYLRGARMAGYNLVLFVDDDRAWKDIDIDVMLAQIDGKFGAEEYFEKRTFPWPNDNDKEYWFFCEKLI